MFSVNGLFIELKSMHDFLQIHYWNITGTAAVTNRNDVLLTLLYSTFPTNLSNVVLWNPLLVLKFK